MKLLFMGADGWPTEDETDTLLYACATETCHLYPVKKGKPVPKCACGEETRRATMVEGYIVPIKPRDFL